MNALPSCEKSGKENSLSVVSEVEDIEFEIQFVGFKLNLANGHMMPRSIFGIFPNSIKIGIFISISLMLSSASSTSHAQTSENDKKFLDGPVENIHLCYSNNPQVRCDLIGIDAFHQYYDKPNQANLINALAISLLSKITTITPKVKCDGFGTCSKTLTTRCETDNPNRLGLLHSRMTQARSAIKMWVDVLSEPSITVLDSSTDQGPPRDYGFRNNSNRNMLFGFYYSLGVEGSQFIKLNIRTGYSLACSEEGYIEAGVNVDAYRYKSRDRKLQ